MPDTDPAAPDLGALERYIQEDFVRASGPGGQNVNKVATAVQLRFDVEAAELPAEVAARLQQIAGRRFGADGILRIEARRHRTRERNRQDARQRLQALLERAAEIPKPRRPTRVPRSQKRKRLEGKERRSQTKQLRGKVTDDDH